MKKALFIMFIVFDMLCVVSCKARTEINEIPMYGNVTFNSEQKKCNEEFINNVVKQNGSREAASKEAIKLGWKYYYNKNFSVSMKRFNQAWLLDPNNAEAYYGFAVLVSIQGKTEEAVSFYKRTLELDPNHPIALANLARSYKDRAYDLYIKRREEYPDTEVKKILGEALVLYEKAVKVAKNGSDLRLTDLNSDLRYIYYGWAVALEFNGEYAKAWEKIKLSRKYGGDKLIEPGFIQELSSFMPEPK